MNKFYKTLVTFINSVIFADVEKNEKTAHGNSDSKEGLESI